MNQLVFKNDEQVVTTSISVAENFGKQHGHVLRDIESLKKDVSNFGEMFKVGETLDSYGRPRKTYFMNRDGFTLLAMGFTGKTAMKFKLDYMNAFNQMEKQLQELNKPSYMIDDPIKRAEIWITEQKEKQELKTKNLMLEQQVSEYEPKATYVDEILKSKDTVTISQVAEDYGMTGQEMNKLLHQIGIQYKMGGQWLLYSKHKGQGYTKSNTVDITHKNGRKSVAMHTKWTQKGRLFIYEELKANDVLPLMDIQVNKTKELVGVQDE